MQTHVSPVVHLGCLEAEELKWLLLPFSTPPPGPGLPSRTCVESHLVQGPHRSSAGPDALGLGPYLHSKVCLYSKTRFDPLPSSAAFGLFPWLCQRGGACGLRFLAGEEAGGVREFFLFFFFSFRNQGFGLRLACSLQTDLSKHSSAVGRDGLQHWAAPVPPATLWGWLPRGCTECLLWGTLL